jgi:hypothetical protein
MLIEVKFDFGDEVYLVTDSENTRLIVGMELKPGGLVVYELALGAETSYHYAFEITREKIYE